MVLLTYKSGAVPGSFSSNGAIPDSVENDEGKHEGPKTAYLDKMYKFEAFNAYASEERCDLFFICQGGDQVPAHRLVISNASKYIMAMQDDQPPWYPVYISVPDLPKQMIQTLVKLAYTGKMTLPPATAPDELLDAMQTLGWVHTDCLTASYIDSAAANDDDSGNAVSSRTAESLETVLKMKFPVASKEKEDADSSDDDEDRMEMDLPDVLLSDEEENGVTSNNLEKTPKKKVSTNAGRRSARKSLAASSTAVNNNTTPLKKKATNKVSSSPKTTRRNASPAVAVKKNDKQDAKKDSSVAPASPEKSELGRRGRKNNTVEASPTPSNSKDKEQSKSPVIEEVESESNQEPEPEAVRSRTRTIRKPKKFDDAIVLTPTKRKETTAKAATPTKSPTKATSSKQTEEPDKTKKAPNAVSTKKADSTESTPAIDKSPSKSRGSTSSEKTPLITSFFTKQNSRGSAEDVSAIEESVRKAAANIVDVQNSSASSRSRKSSRFEEKSDAAVKDGDDKIEFIEEKKTDKKEENAGTSSSTLRRRAKSTASTKSDKDAEPNEAAASTNDESSKTGTLRRKRNLHESEELEPDSATNNGVPVPTTRGRKPSTISNASKSSKASNKAADSTVDGDGDLDADGSESGPRRKRIRQE